MTFGASGSRFRRLRLLRNFGFGVWVGAIAAGVLGITLDARFSVFVNHRIGAVVGALIALFVGALALGGTLAVIDNQNEIEVARRNNRLAAERACLPMALSELGQISRNRVEYAIFGDQGGGFEKAPWRATPETIEILKACIEFTADNKDPTVREAHRKLIDLMGFYQIVVARADGRRWESRIEDSEYSEFRQRADAITEWAAFQWLVEALFYFARALTSKEVESRPHLSFQDWLTEYRVDGTTIATKLRGDHHVPEDPAAYFRTF